MIKKMDSEDQKQFARMQKLTLYQIVKRPTIGFNQFFFPIVEGIPHYKGLTVRQGNITYAVPEVLLPKFRGLMEYMKRGKVFAEYQAATSHAAKYHLYEDLRRHRIPREESGVNYKVFDAALRLDMGKSLK
jgi:hypothetical protein